MTELRQRMDDAMVLRGFVPRTRETYLESKESGSGYS
jgi:hypothetical protein